MFFYIACTPTKKLISSSTIEVRFHVINKSIHNSKIQAYLVVDTLQKKTDLGFNFIFKIVNDSSNNLLITDLFSNLYLALYDETGFNYIIPSDYHSFTNRVGPLELKSFDLISTTISGKQIGLNLGKNFLIPAKSTFEIQGRIINVLKNPNKNTVDKTVVSKLDPGRFNFLLNFSLPTKGKPEFMTTKPLIVSYYE